MEDKLKEFSKKIMEALEALTLRVEKLEMDIKILKGEESQFQNEDDQPIDLSLDVAEEATEEAIPVQEDKLEKKEDVPVQEESLETLEEESPVQEEKAEVKEEAFTNQDGFSGLFGEEGLSLEAEKKEGRQYKDLNGKNSSNGKIIMEVMAEKTAWYRDMPGAEVKSLRSAIALGEQVMFIKRLFRGDSALYQDTIEKLNAMTGLSSAVEYISQTFPEWDMESDDVYRFMMAVRRKIR